MFMFNESIKGLQKESEIYSNSQIGKERYTNKSMSVTL